MLFITDERTRAQQWPGECVSPGTAARKMCFLRAKGERLAKGLSEACNLNVRMCQIYHCQTWSVKLPLCIKFTHRISPPGHQEPAVSAGSRSNHLSGMEHWISALTKPGPLGFSVLVCSSLTFTKRKETQLYQCLITPLILLLQWKSIKIRIIVTSDL